MTIDISSQGPRIEVPMVSDRILSRLQLNEFCGFAMSELSQKRRGKDFRPAVEGVMKLYGITREAAEYLLHNRNRI